MSNVFFIIIPALIIVAFVTLIERKILGLAQYRKGPNKVSYAGLLQPIADAVKLFSNEWIKPFQRNLILFTFSPTIRLFLILCIWRFVPIKEREILLYFSAFLVLVMIRLGVYPLLLSGWASNNKFSSWGAVRGVAQTVSYEVRLTVILFSFLLCASTFQLKELLHYNFFSTFITFNFLLVFTWLLLCVMETNRTPFDFAEGESELVSGFNTEYSAGIFALIFLAEYARILFLSLLFVCICGLETSSLFNAYMLTWLVTRRWIWLRATYPRFRYDLLMSIAWKSVLPTTLACAIYIIFL